MYNNVDIFINCRIDNLLYSICVYLYKVVLYSNKIELNFFIYKILDGFYK